MQFSSSQKGPSKSPNVHKSTKMCVVVLDGMLVLNVVQSVYPYAIDVAHWSGNKLQKRKLKLH